MTINSQDIDDLTAGDTVQINFTVKDRNGDVKDITAISARWALADDRGGSKVLEKSTTDGIQVTDAANGELQIELLPSETDGFSGSYYHELEITDSDGRVSTVATGTLWFSASTV